MIEVGQAQIEAYVLLPTRSVAAVERFLTTFAPKRSPAQVDYPYPQFGEESSEWFATSEEAIERLVNDPSGEYALYWNVEDDEPLRNAMVFFRSDGSLVVGLGGRIDEEAALTCMQNELGARFGYLGSCYPPPESAAEFIEICRRADAPRLFEGELVKET